MRDDRIRPSVHRGLEHDLDAGGNLPELRMLLSLGLECRRGRGRYAVDDDHLYRE